MSDIEIRKADTAEDSYILSLHGGNIYVAFTSFKLESSAFISLWRSSYNSEDPDVFLAHIFTEKNVQAFCKAWRKMKCMEEC